MNVKCKEMLKRAVALSVLAVMLANNVFAFDSVVPYIEKTSEEQEISSTFPVESLVPEQTDMPELVATPVPTEEPLPTQTPVPTKTPIPEETTVGPTAIPTETSSPVVTPMPTTTPVPAVTVKPIDNPLSLLLKDWQIVDKIDEIVGKTSEIGWMSEEELKQFAQEIQEFCETLEQELNDQQRTDLEEDLVRLENAAAAVQEVCNVWDALHNGTLSELEQTGKENSWRYQNGSLVEQDEVVPYANVQLQSETGDYWGIDVSHHQGTIDWDAVKATGVDFAIIRCGFGSDYVSQDDKQWRANVEDCERLGIPYGVYLYSYATSLDQARSEAAHALRLLKGTSPSLPVYIDLEEPRTQVLGGEMITQIANTFCSILDENGYKAGVYASLSWWQYYFQDWFTSNTNYYHWIAHWSSSCGYDGRYELWQYDNSGFINGISERVDLNYWYGGSLSVQDTVQEEEAYSAIYNYQYYITKYNDLSHLNRMQAIDHFLSQGIKEGRQACEEFDPIIYRQNYPDLQAAYQNNTEQYYYHYLYTGKAEGRNARTLINSSGISIYNGFNYSDVYDYGFYISNNPDVYLYYNGDMYEILAHFVNQGMKEGRRAIQTFDPQIYRSNYPDLWEVYGEDLSQYYIHYIYAGKQEGREAEEKVPREALTVYKGLDYSAVYDYDFYIANNPDVFQYYQGDDYLILSHFVDYGMAEKRSASEMFNVEIYRNNYADLEQAYGDQWRSYYIHYIYAGKSEGRIANQKI